jgi:hypothetical protein
VPLVLDAPFANVGPKVAEMVMSSLDSYVGLVQIVALRPDHTLVRWAEAHGRHPAPTEP